MPSIEDNSLPYMPTSQILLLFPSQLRRCVKYLLTKIFFVNVRTRFTVRAEINHQTYSQQSSSLSIFTLHAWQRFRRWRSVHTCSGTTETVLTSAAYWYFSMSFPTSKGRCSQICNASGFLVGQPGELTCWSSCSWFGTTGILCNHQPWKKSPSKGASHSCD